MGQHEKALVEYAAALSINSKYADAHYNRGETYRKLGKTDYAIVAYETFLRFADPKVHSSLMDTAHKTLSELKNTSTSSLNGESELARLLDRRSQSLVLHSAKRAHGKREMTADVSSWFGRVAMILAEKWNAQKYKTKGSDLFQNLTAREPHKIRADQWASALATYYLPAEANESKHFRFLLLTPSQDDFLINWPELERFWPSELFSAFMVLYAELVALMTCVNRWLGMKHHGAIGCELTFRAKTNVSPPV